MKKLITITLSIILLCLCVFPAHSASPKISVKAPNAVVGETITVTVNLSANSNLGGIDFTAKFNTSYFQLVSNSASTTSVFMAEVKESSSSVRYAGIASSAVNSSGTLMTFKLKVLKTGGKISISVSDAVDGNDNDVTSTVSTASTTVNCSHKNAKWSVIKKATCTEKGTETLNCSCGHTKTREIKMSEHTYSKWKVEKEATETEKGLKVAECSICGKKKEQAIPKITTTTATTTEVVTESTTETSSTQAQSTSANPTDEPVDIAPSKEVSVPKIVATTIFAVLGVEALGLVIFFLIKKKKKSE